MFEQCRAVIIGADPRQSRTLELIARNLGFGDAVDYSEGGSATRANVTFCFVDDQMPDEGLVEVLEVVRAERRNNLCYSPVILFSEDSRGEPLRHVRLGFDDGVMLPVSRENLSLQLGRQLYEDQVYVETKDYLGPDRRRMDRGPDLRITASPYAQVMFYRDPERGIRVLGREQRGYRFRTRPDSSTHFMPKVFGHLVH
jgi:hypothetical protein